MLREDLLEFKYYLDRLSMFMKESHGIAEQTEIFYRQLVQVNSALDQFFGQLDIFGFTGEPTESSAVLDKIGAIFECYRNFTVLVPEQGQTPAHHVEVDLDDRDFAVYIKCQIAKQNFMGTREELAKIYSTYDESEKKRGLLDLTFIYVFYQVTDTTPVFLNSSQCDIYWSNATEYSSAKLEALFRAGYLTIESMGILYNRTITNVEFLGTFARVLERSAGDYYAVTSGGDTVYLIWDPATGWAESASPGSGTEIAQVSSTDDVPNYGKWHNYADENDPSIEGGYYA